MPADDHRCWPASAHVLCARHQSHRSCDPNQTTITPPAPSPTIDGESWLGGESVTVQSVGGPSRRGAPSAVKRWTRNLRGARDLALVPALVPATKKPPVAVGDGTRGGERRSRRERGKLRATRQQDWGGFHRGL
jgi:hypothetical protein